MIALLTLLLATVAAWAIPVPVTVCVKGTTDFVDADSSHGDDLWTSNNAKAMRGIFVEIKDANTWLGNTVESGYVSADDGCMDVSLESTNSHWIKVASRMELDGRSLWVTNGSTLYAVMSVGSITPVWGNTYTYTMDGAASGLEWVNVAAAASFTMARRLDAWPDLSQHYEVALQEHPKTGVTTAYQPFDANVTEHGYEADGGVVYLSPNGMVPPIFRKYTIAHELGHHLLHFYMWNGVGDMGGFAANIDYTAPLDSDCEAGPSGSHFYNSKEYQGAAIIEGHAHYVAAVAFNHTGGVSQTNYDCKMVPNGPVEWDPNAGYGLPDEFSCEGAEGNDAGGIEHTEYNVDARDFMGDYCLSGTTSDRGVEHDWLRFFWDADTDDGVTVFGLQDSLDLLDYAMPWNWLTDLGGSVLARVAVEGAFTYYDSGAFVDVWDDWAVTNGVHR